MKAEKIRTVFAGTPDFAVPSLHALLARPELDVVAVYTQPDRPAGRGRRLAQSAVKQQALAAGLAVEQPVTLAVPSELARFAAHSVQLLVVAAYGLMLPDAFIADPVIAINVHASLLPRWRGAAPIQRALMAGDGSSGISIMRVVRRLDAGPVWLTRACNIEDTDTGGTLHDRLAGLGAAALDDAVDRVVAGTIIEVPQDETMVTYAHKIGPADRAIDWSRPAVDIARQVRALNPQPAATARLRGLDVKILSARAEGGADAATPGDVLSAAADGIVVATASGCLRIVELQPAGKQRMSALAFVNGYGSHL